MPIEPFLLLLLLLFPFYSSSAPVDVNDYLSRYGYLDKEKLKSGGQLVDATHAIIELQAMYGLPQTGKVDEATMRIMRTPRCAVPDKRPGRSKRALFSKWDKTTLTYYVNSFPQYMDARYVEAILWNSLLRWHNISTLQFRPAREARTADLVIDFPSPHEHASCSSKFGNNDLAHAFFPTNGRVHFNMDWRWDDDTRLNQVSVHEFGHAIGLQHTSNPVSVMFALNTPEAKEITTSEINQLRESYGVKEGVGWVEEDVIVRETEHERNTPPDPCTSSVHAAMRRRGEYLFFKGGWMWRFSSDTRSLVSVNRISSFYPPLQSVDAAIEILDRVFLFSSHELFIFENNRMNAPVTLRTLGIRASDRIDLAFSWHATNFEGEAGVYLIDDTNDLYYRIDPKSRKVVVNYPKQRNLQWRYIPKADAAFSYGTKNDLMFVVGDKVYQANLTSIGSVRIAEGYPKKLRYLFEYCNTRDRVGRGERERGDEGETERERVIREREEEMERREGQRAREELERRRAYEEQRREWERRNEEMKREREMILRGRGTVGDRMGVKGTSVGEGEKEMKKAHSHHHHHHSHHVHSSHNFNCHLIVYIPLLIHLLLIVH